MKETKFKIKFLEQKGSIKFYITHSKLHGRYIKHIGKGSTTDYSSEITRLGVAINSSFEGKIFDWTDVGEFMDHYVDELKRECSVLDYKDEFIKFKTNTLNRATLKKLSRSAIDTYERTINYFEKFLTAKKISTDPSVIDQTVMDEYFIYLRDHHSAHNYIVKLHDRLKTYLKFAMKKGLAVNPTYSESTFSEKYDNQEPDEDDRALTKDQIVKLIDLRKDFAKGNIKLPDYKTTRSITEDLQSRQRKRKIENLRLTLDCFLFMVATGQYISDIKGAKLIMNLSNPNAVHIKYRRVKNNSLCKLIPIHDNHYFLGQTIIDQYKIKNGKNFPYELTLNCFNDHLLTIGKLAGFDFKIMSKAARKTFASVLYFDYNVPLGEVQLMLGHRNSEMTQKYLRIQDNDRASGIHDRLKE